MKMANWRANLQEINYLNILILLYGKMGIMLDSCKTIVLHLFIGRRYFNAFIISNCYALKIVRLIISLA